MSSDLSQQRVNYDAIAHLYDEPLRDHALDANLQAFLAARPSLDPAQTRILDLGCGTGKQLTANRGHYGQMPMVGMDLFLGMVRQAQKRSRAIHWVQGDNTAVPFADSSIHYITNQFSYQHVQDKDQFWAEVWRILGPDGRFVLTNIDPWQMPGWFIYRHFPAAEALDFQDFLPADTLIHRLRQAGFAPVQIQRQPIVQNLTLRWVHQYASQRFRASELLAILDEAYLAGLQTIENELARYGPEKIIASEVCLLTIKADKPAGGE